jgi:hypothetical protein
MRQAQFVADNIVLALQGREPSHVYKPEWAEAGITLTLGMVSTEHDSLSIDPKIANFHTD